MLCKLRSLYFAAVSVLVLVILCISGCGEDEKEDPGQLLKEAWKYYEAGEYDKADRTFDKVLDSQPNSTQQIEMYVGLGWTCGKTAMLQESIANFQSVLSVEPQNADALAGMAFAYLADDQYDQAIAYAKQALASNPGDSLEYCGVTSRDLHIVLAESYYCKGELENAQNELAELDPTVMELDPASEDYAVRLMESLERISGG